MVFFEKWAGIACHQIRNGPVILFVQRSYEHLQRKRISQLEYLCILILQNCLCRFYLGFIRYLPTGGLHALIRKAGMSAD